MYVDLEYKKLINTLITKGKKRKDRTGVGTRSLFGYQMRIPVEDRFPILSLKETHWPSIIHELCWFMGCVPEKYREWGTNIKYLVDNKVSIWNDWPYEKYKRDIEIENSRSEEKIIPLTMKEFSKKIQDDEIFAKSYGELGPVYGKQWTDWGGVPGLFSGLNQIDLAIEQIKHNPFSRRIIVSAWNPLEIKEMALPPCHTLFQFYVSMGKDNKPLGLSLQLYQRSCDVFLGLPFNIASYGALLYFFASLTGLVPKELIITLGDVHLYENHLKQADELSKRRISELWLPKLNIKKNELYLHWTEYRAEDFMINNYNPLPKIKAPVAV